MKIWQVAFALGLLAVAGAAEAQSDSGFGSPDIYGGAKTGKPKTEGTGNRENRTGRTANGTQADRTPNGEEASLKRTLQDIYDRCVTATKKRDESVMAGLRANTFIYKDAKGKTYSRGDIEASERHALNDVTKIESVSSQVDSAASSGSRVTATVRQYFAGTMNDVQGKSHKITLATTTRDAWMQSATGWKLQSVQVVSQQETRDGKAYDPTAAQNASNSNQNNRRNGSSGNRGTRNGGYRAPAAYRPPTFKLGGNRRNVIYLGG